MPKFCINNEDISNGARSLNPLISPCVCPYFFSSHSPSAPIRGWSNYSNYAAMEFAFIITLIVAFIIAFSGFLLALKVKKLEKEKVNMEKVSVWCLYSYLEWRKYFLFR